jgi:hypothetical protein
MPQPPFLLDSLQVAPGSGDTITISRDAPTGSLRFLDSVVSLGVNLSDLVGIRNVTGVLVVGRGGGGSQFTSIQDALDAIPTSSDINSPYLVLVLPGVYSENLVLDKDGVSLVGLGGVVLTSISGDTISIKSSISATPKNVLIRGVRVENPNNGGSCVRVLGADTFASATLTVNNSPLAVGDVVVIDGTNLTGVIGARTSGANNFSVSGVTTDAIAAEICSAINDPNNAFSTLVEASPLLNVVNLTAKEAGSGGNSITLASTTNPLGRITLSGPNLSGGGSAGSMVGDGALVLDQCELFATGLGSYQVRAETAGHILVRGGSWSESSTSSLSSISNCAKFSVSGVDQLNDLEFSYDTSQDRPNDTSCVYSVFDCGIVGEILSDLEGEGSLRVQLCPDVASISQTGDRDLLISHSSLGTLTLSGSTSAVSNSSTRTSASSVSGSPTLSESKVSGSLVFAGTNSEAYTFDVEQPDTDYAVLLDSPSSGSVLSVSNKTSSGFTVQSSSPLVGTVKLVVVR